MRMRQCTRIQRNVLIHLLEAYHLPLRQFGDGSGVKCYFFHDQNADWIGSPTRLDLLYKWV